MFPCLFFSFVLVFLFFAFFLGGGMEGIFFFLFFHVLWDVDSVFENDTQIAFHNWQVSLNGWGNKFMSKIFVIFLDTPFRKSSDEMKVLTQMHYTLHLITGYR